MVWRWAGLVNAAASVLNGIDGHARADIGIATARERYALPIFARKSARCSTYSLTSMARFNSWGSFVAQFKRRDDDAMDETGKGAGNEDVTTSSVRRLA